MKNLLFLVVGVAIVYLAVQLSHQFDGVGKFMVGYFTGAIMVNAVRFFKLHTLTITWHGLKGDKNKNAED